MIDEKVHPQETMAEIARVVREWSHGPMLSETALSEIRTLMLAYEAARSAEPVAWATPEHGRRGGHPMPVEPAAEFMGLKVLVNPQLPPDAAYIESRRADGSVDRVCVRSHPKEAPDV